MNELKPEDVMRALECHSLADISTCDDCPYCDISEQGNCGCDMARDALALIREKDAEIERLREVILKGDYSSYTARLATESWHRNNLERIRRLEAEIERLSHQCSECAGCTQWKCDCSNIRVEAITEFAERLKTFYKHLPGNTVGGAVEYHIDQIAKEMKEGRV